MVNNHDSIRTTIKCISMLYVGEFTVRDISSKCVFGPVLFSIGFECYAVQLFYSVVEIVSAICTIFNKWLRFRFPPETITFDNS